MKYVDVFEISVHHILKYEFNVNSIHMELINKCT